MCGTTHSELTSSSRCLLLLPSFDSRFSLLSFLCRSLSSYLYATERDSKDEGWLIDNKDIGTNKELVVSSINFYYGRFLKALFKYKHHIIR